MESSIVRSDEGHIEKLNKARKKTNRLMYNTKNIEYLLSNCKNKFKIPSKGTVWMRKKTRAKEGILQVMYLILSA